MRGVFIATAVALGGCGVGARVNDPEAERKALAALRELEAIAKVDAARPGKPVVAVHFPPNFGKVTDEHLAHLKAFPHLRSVAIPNKPFVTDAGLANLAELNQLEEVVLNGTSVTAEAVLRFLNADFRRAKVGDIFE